MASSADVLRRLEAVASRLEAYASALPAAGAGGGAKRGGAGETKQAPSVVAYGAYYQNSVVPFVAVVRAVKEIAYIGDIIETAFKHTGVVIEAASKCKRPADAALVTYLNPVISSCALADRKADNRSPFFPQQKAVAEGLPALNWLMAPGVARDIVQNGLEQADFHLIKLLTAAKAKTGDEQKDLRAFVSTFKALLTNLGEYVQEFHTKGLEWTPRGGDVKDFKPSADAGAAGAGAAPAAAEEEAGGAPPPPPGPPPSAEDLAGGAVVEKKVAPGMGAVFDSINRGGDVTSGLKKVDASQKAKNMKDRPVLVPKAKAATETKAPAKSAAKKPPTLVLTKGTWFCENYEDTTVDIPSVEIKQSVYVLKAKNCTITVPDKCKSISVDGCVRVRIVFRSVVSNFELFNSQRCTAECTESFPSIAIDKSSGCIVALTSRAGLATPPQIVTSNISECNIQVPGAREEDDPIEIPIPEQFETALVVGAPGATPLYKLRTNPTAHGD